MYKENNSDIQIDLVFKCNLTKGILNKINISENNLIFEKFFWERVFFRWLNILVLEKPSQCPIKILDKKLFSFSFEIINNNEISILNQEWLNKKGPTDVLSFPIIDDQQLNQNFTFVEIGDLFISLEMAFKQSQDYQHSLKREMLLLSSHGFLHLLGWEHNNNKELISMLNFQEYLVSSLN